MREAISHLRHFSKIAFQSWVRGNDKSPICYFLITRGRNVSTKKTLHTGIWRPEDKQIFPSRLRNHFFLSRFARLSHQDAPAPMPCSGMPDGNGPYLLTSQACWSMDKSECVWLYVAGQSRLPHCLERPGDPRTTSLPSCHLGHCLIFPSLHFPFTKCGVIKMALMTSSGGVVGIKGANACESISGVCKA